MLPRVYKEFERICSERKAGGAVLEIGAVPSTDSLLCMKSLRNATQKIGINLKGPSEYRDFKIIQGNGNAMTCFGDASFDVVLCNAVLEHDPYFWKTIAEIKRVAKPGALIVIGAPGYARLKMEKISSLLNHVPLLRRWRRSYFGLLFFPTLTIHVHNEPGDFYRFSRQAFEEVLLAGLTEVEVLSVFLPPIIIGAGRKPVPAEPGCFSPRGELRNPSPNSAGSRPPPDGSRSLL
jgi:SAM-dependent methyltransferase